MTSLNAFVRTSLWWLVPLGLLLVALGAETNWGRAVQKRPVAEPLPEPKPIAGSGAALSRLRTCGSVSSNWKMRSALAAVERMAL